MTEQTPWLLIDVGNTAIKWRLANAEALLDVGGSVSDVLSLCQRVEAEPWGVVGLASVASDSADAELITALTASGARVVHRATAQLNCLAKVQPRWASISVREIAREPDLADSIYGCCAEQGTEVQHILYDVSDITLLNKWQHEGIVRNLQNSVLFVLGRYSEGQTSSPEDLTPMLNAMPTRSQWMACAFGPLEHDCLIEAAHLGGNLRVGFENSLQDSDGNIWSDNSASVAVLKTKLGMK